MPENVKATSRKASPSQKIVKALSHRIRMEILSALPQGRIASASELAAELGHPIPHLTHHMNVLKDADMIEFVYKKARGRRPAASYFRRTAAPWFDSEAWAQVPVADRVALSAHVLGLVADDAVSALVSGEFDRRDDRHLSRSLLALDEEGFTELAQAADELLERAHEIEARSLARLGGDGTPVRAMLGILLFERAAGEPPPE